MSHATQKMTGEVSPKKNSVQFNADEDEKDPLFTSVYLMRNAAKKQLGIKDLDKVKGIEVTVRVIK